MEFNKRKVFNLLATYYFLENEGQVVINKKFIEIYDGDNDLLATYEYVNCKLRITFTNVAYHTRDDLVQYLDLLVDLEDCLVK